MQGVPCKDKETVKEETVKEGTVKEGTVKEETNMGFPRWAYGITTVPQRMDNLLPKTIASLASGGFDRPWIFVDGSEDLLLYKSRFPSAAGYTLHYPNLLTYGTWVLSLAELYIRNPNSSMYAMFQDDFVCYRNLRAYLDHHVYPEKGYWNLYTFPQNQELAPKVGLTVRHRVGWYESNQRGRGAVALVFDRATVLTLLSSQHMVERPLDAKRGWKAVDGGVVSALAKAGYRELVHNPSLVQHTGVHSTMRNKPHPQANSFRGGEYDAMSLLNEVGV